MLTRRAFAQCAIPASLLLAEHASAALTHCTPWGLLQSASPSQSCPDALEAIRTKFDLPAILAGSMRIGGSPRVRACGVRVRGEVTAVETTDRVHLGSCTKALTALLALKECEAGRLRLNERVEELFPELASTIPQALREATVRELLQHQSGIAADAMKTSAWRDACSFAADGKHSETEQREAFVRAILVMGPMSARGKFAYSNQGYAVVGHAIERRNGKPFEALLIERVLTPMSASDAWGFGPPSADSFRTESGAARAMCGHQTDGKPVGAGQGADNPPAIAPAGRVHASMEAWLRLLVGVAQLERAALKSATASPDGETKIEEERLPLGLSIESAREIARLPTGDSGSKYGLGWGVADRPWAGVSSVDATGAATRRGGRVLTHSGSNTMWYAVAWVAPERGLVLAAATNQGGDRAAAATDAAVAMMLSEDGAAES